MDFYLDIGFAVLLRVLKDRRQLKRLMPAFVKLAHAILAAYENDPLFAKELESRQVASKVK